MLDWLWSKLIVAFAAGIILSSVSAYFISERDQAESEELEIVARNLASFVNSVLRLPGTAKFMVGPDHDANLAIPSEIGGARYMIGLRQDSVIVGANDRTTVYHWSGTLRFWRWDGTCLDSDILRDLDESHPALNLISGEVFQISLEEILFGDTTVLLAFAIRAA